MPVTLENIHLHLEIPKEETQFFKEQLSIEDAKKKLESFKKLVKKQRKLLAKKYHPDFNPNNLEKMKIINHIVDEVMKIRIQSKIIQRPSIIIRTYTSNYGNTVYTSTTSTTTGSW